MCCDHTPALSSEPREAATHVFLLIMIMSVTSTGQLRALLLLVCACFRAAVGEFDPAYELSAPLGPGWHPAPGQRIPYGTIATPDQGYARVMQRATILFQHASDQRSSSQLGLTK